MQRVLVIGCAGTGKSTFAARLAVKTGLPLHALDAMFWLPGWKMRDEAEFDATLEKVLEQPAWVMDGNYRRTLHWRCKYADMVILFRRSRWLCLWRVLKRLRDGTEQAGGCPQKVDMGFVKYILWTYPRVYRADIAALKAAHPRLRWITLDSDRAAEEFLRNLPEGQEIQGLKRLA